MGLDLRSEILPTHALGLICLQRLIASELISKLSTFFAPSCCIAYVHLPGPHPTSKQIFPSSPLSSSPVNFLNSSTRFCVKSNIS